MLEFQSVEPINYIDLFCGIGGFRIAAEEVFKAHGITSRCVFSSDIDTQAQNSYFANFDELPAGDITKIHESKIPDHDLLFAGFPCQPFSIIGNGKGFQDTRGTLFFDIARILKRKRPLGFILENVKQLVSHNNGKTFNKIINVLRDDLGYFVFVKVMNSLNYGLPQKRERVIIVGYHRRIDFKFPEPWLNYKPLSAILETNVDRRYFVSDYILNKRQSLHIPSVSPSIWHENKSGHISSYPYSCALRAGASYNYLLVDGKRRLTPRELLRLQGFPDTFKIAVTESQLRKQAGNAVPVNLVKVVLEKLLPFVIEDRAGIVYREKDKVDIYK